MAEIIWNRNFVLIFIVLSNLFFIFQTNSTPIKPDCEWVEDDKVERIRDLSDCSKFYYCVKGKAPYQGSCPKDTCYGRKCMYLYFNVNTSSCDYSWGAPRDCFGPPGQGGEGTGSGYYEEEEEEEETTTPEPTTTTPKPTRPPTLEDLDKPNFEIDCNNCGLYPNTYGPCDTYVICVNGQKLEKKCNGGQMFDVKTKECQPAKIATCWTEPDAGPHIRNKQQDECPYHANPASVPYSTLGKTDILQNPTLTNWGEWGKWENCPRGTYATGLYAWRRLLQQGWQIDHAGITAVSFICQSPGGNETNKIIESLAPNLPKDGWPFHYMCKGAVIGFQLNSVDSNGWKGDQIATDNVQGMCSCSAPVKKPYELAMYAPQNGDRGIWTEAQYCKKGQAVCGMQTQMQEYKEYLIGKYDNSGLNNMRVKCCHVPDPIRACVPKEERLLVRICDNSKSNEGLRCDFDSVVGYGVDYDTNKRLIDFYTSLGYSLDANSKAKLAKKIENRLKKQIEDGTELQYTWNEIMPSVQKEESVTSKTIYPKAYEIVELYQIVGKCSYFVMRSNRYVKVIKDGKTGKVKKQEKFEV